MTRFHLGAAVLLAASALARPAHAHLGSSKFVRVERTEAGATAEILVETIDVSMELGLGETPDERALGAREGAIEEWLVAGITLRAGQDDCPGVARFVGIVTRDDRRFVRATMDWRCPTRSREVVLRDATVFPDDAQHETFVRVILADDSEPRILRRGRQETSLGAPLGLGALLSTYAAEGALHFATGYDHVLFLLALVLAAGIVAARDGRRRALRDVAIIVTAFTLGHSVTLVAAALEWVVLPSKPVEAVIAASIAVVAALNVVRPRQRKSMPWLAVGFGLVHGLGFSAVLAEQGLPSGQRVVALVAFNVGIELAQLAFVAVVLFPLGWLARFDRYEPVVVRGGSVVIGLLALAWLVERVAA